MKIVAVLDTDPTVGGGFHQALAAILEMHSRCAGEFEFSVLTTGRGNLEVLRNAGVAAEFAPKTLRDHLVARISSGPWWRALQHYFKLVAPLERRLLGAGCALVYFVAPTTLSSALQRLNFITTVFDLSHRDTPEFPEVRELGMFAAREQLLRSSLPMALVVIADSDTLADSIAARYGIDRARIVPLPHAPAPFMSSAGSDTASVLSKYGLEPGYFFYPAQFWAHKNHVRLLEAAAQLRAAGTPCRVVFSGGDRGNRPHVEQFARGLGLADCVSFLGLVPPVEMRALYDGCAAVVVPTYFGPTNMPPLEAWLAGRPCVYSAHFRDQVGDAAICVDPDSADELAAAMTATLDAATRTALVERGYARLRELGCARERGAQDLMRRIRQFAVRRTTWTAAS